MKKAHELANIAQKVKGARDEKIRKQVKQKLPAIHRVAQTCVKAVISKARKEASDGSRYYNARFDWNAKPLQSLLCKIGASRNVPEVNDRIRELVVRKLKTLLTQRGFRTSCTDRQYQTEGMGWETYDHDVIEIKITW